MPKAMPLAALLLLLLVSCSLTPIQVSSFFPSPTPTATLTPTATRTLIPTSTPTVAPTPLGGGGVIAFVSKSGNEGLITLYEVDGGRTFSPDIQVPLKEGAETSPFGVSSASISPVGGKLVFSYCLFGVREPGQHYLFCRHTLFTSNVDGSDVAQLTETKVDQDWPVWSPDGSKIGYVSDRSDIYAINADGSERTRLTDAPGWDWFPSWSPDGKRIAFQSQRDGNFQIYVMNADRTGGVLQLTKIKGICSSAAWSPDGETIAFIAYLTKSKASDVYVMGTDGSHPTNLTNGKYAFVGSPAWSPDGRMLAFKCTPGLCIMKPDGTGLVEVTGLPSIAEGSGLSWARTVVAEPEAAANPGGSSAPQATATARPRVLMPGAIRVAYGTKVPSLPRQGTQIFGFEGNEGDQVTVLVEKFNAQEKNRWCTEHVPGSISSFDVRTEDGSELAPASEGENANSTRVYALPYSGVYYIHVACRGAGCTDGCVEQDVTVTINP